MGPGGRGGRARVLKFGLGARPLAPVGDPGSRVPPPGAAASRAPPPPATRANPDSDTWGTQLRPCHAGALRPRPDCGAGCPRRVAPSGVGGQLPRGPSCLPGGAWRASGRWSPAAPAAAEGVRSGWLVAARAPPRAPHSPAPGSCRGPLRAPEGERRGEQGQAASQKSECVCKLVFAQKLSGTCVFRAGWGGGKARASSRPRSGASLKIEGSYSPLPFLSHPPAPLPRPQLGQLSFGAGATSKGAVICPRSQVQLGALVASWGPILPSDPPAPDVLREGTGVWENYLRGPLFCLPLVFAHLGVCAVTKG